MRNSPTYTSHMYHAYIKSLMILIAGGAPRNGERDRWIARISETTGIGERSLLAAYWGQWISKDQYVSKRTLELLEKAAENARKTRTVVEFLELQIEIWETRPDLYQWRIALARRFVADLRRHDAAAVAGARRDAAECSGSTVPEGDGAGAAASSSSAT